MSRWHRLDWLTARAAAIGLLAGMSCLVLSLWHVANGFTLAERTQLETDEGLQILSEIRSVGAAEGKLPDPERSASFAQQLEAAFELTGVAPEALQSVTPRSGRSGAEPSYQIVLQPVTLVSGLKLLETLSNTGTARVIALDLRAPSTPGLQQAQETWRLEAELINPSP
ncbi:MAG: hypothetical protein AAGJ38_00730 [Planctomycetota bacterium]